VKGNISDPETTSAKNDENAASIIQKSSLVGRGTLLLIISPF